MDRFCEQILPAPGQIARVVVPSVPYMPVWIGRPQKETDPGSVLLAVHGISRNSVQQAEAFSKIANQLGIWLIAPEFSEQVFPRYQQFSANPRSARADLALNKFLLAWRGERRLQRLQLHLFGYSGGAQFVHRYAYCYPDYIRSLVVSSAGWYCLPDSRRRYPYGLGGWPRWLPVPNIDSMLHIPTLVLVGSADTERDRSLRTSLRLDSSQGVNRVERARCWVDMIRSLKEQRALGSVLRYQELVGQSHDFLANVLQSEMLALIGEFIEGVQREAE